MQLQISLSPRRIVTYLVMGVIFFTIASTAIQIGKYVFDYRADWTTLLNMDRELNFPTWYSTFMLAFCGILLKIIALTKKQESDRESSPKGNRYTRDWQLLSLIFFWLAIDEVLSIHEILIIPEISDALKLPWFLHSMWVIPGAIFVLWFIKHYSKFIRHLSPQSRRYFVLAAGLYIGGALIMEMVGSHIAEAQGQQHLLYALIATLEEMMEMLGVVVFIYGLLDYLRQEQNPLNLEIKLLH